MAERAEAMAVQKQKLCLYNGCVCGLLSYLKYNVAGVNAIMQKSAY